MKLYCCRRLEIVRAQFSPCAFVSSVLPPFWVGSRHRGYSIITSNRSDTQRFDVCKMCFFEVNVCLDEYELFARPRVAGHYKDVKCIDE